MPISGAQLLEALDGAATELDQVLRVLRRAGHPEPAALTLATGDRLLLAVVEELTGHSVEITAACPACGETNEIVLRAAALDEHPPRTRWLDPGRGVREPCYRDLADLPAEGSLAVETLGRRCAIGEVDPADAVEALDEVDGSLAGPIGIACVKCAQPIEIEADVQHLALRALRRSAEDLDRDVHLLASRYRWDLATIEALPDARRRRLALLIEAG